jgi:Putative metallopeptidase
MITRSPQRTRMPLLLLALAFAPRPADAQPAPAQPATPQAKVDAFAQALAKNPKFKKLSPKYLQAVTEFVIGNTLFVMLHELGHAVTDQLKIPVLGRKEDAADMFAATRLIKFNNDFTDGALDAAARGWFMTDRRDTKNGDQVPYYDEHGLDQQRAYQIVCLMVGTGDPKYQALADETKLPKDRQKSCSGDYADASGSWNAAMMPHLRAPDQPKTKIDVVYGEGKGDLDVIAQGLRSVGLLEAIAERAASALAWPEPFTIEAQSCGYLGVDPGQAHALPVLRARPRFRRPLPRLRRDASERPNAQVEVSHRSPPAASLRGT